MEIHPADPLVFEPLPRLRLRRSEKWRTYPDDVLPAFVAEMDVALAEPIRRTLVDAIALGDTGYAQGAGLAEAFAAFAEDWYGWRVDPRSVVLVPDVMVGAAEALRLAVPPASGVVINSPVYPPFRPTILEYGLRVVDVPLLRAPCGWDLDFAGLERAFQDGARGYLLCNPHNPTGRVFVRADLERIAVLARQYDVAVVADENHAPLTLPGSVHTPFVSLGDDLAARAVTVTSAAKAWNLAGLKCAVAIAGSAAMRGTLAGLPAEIPSRAGHLGVLAAITAFGEGRGWLHQMLAHLDRQRALLAALLGASLPSVSYAPPEASYLAWLDCTALGLGADPAAQFLARGRVALSSGLAFGPGGAGFVRLNMGTSAELLREIVARMAATLRAPG